MHGRKFGPIRPHPRWLAVRDAIRIGHYVVPTAAGVFHFVAGLAQPPTLSISDAVAPPPYATGRDYGASVDGSPSAGALLVAAPGIAANAFYV